MQREEPSACLIHSLRDEIGRIDLLGIEQLPVFERIMNLGVRHGARIEPHVDKIRLAAHR